MPRMRSLSLGSSSSRGCPRASGWSSRSTRAGSRRGGRARCPRRPGCAWTVARIASMSNGRRCLGRRCTGCSSPDGVRRPTRPSSRRSSASVLEESLELVRVARVLVLLGVRVTRVVAVVPDEPLALASSSAPSSSCRDVLHVIAVRGTLWTIGTIALPVMSPPRMRTSPRSVPELMNLRQQTSEPWTSVAKKIVPSRRTPFRRARGLKSSCPHCASSHFW